MPSGTNPDEQSAELNTCTTKRKFNPGMPLVLITRRHDEDVVPARHSPVP